MQMSICFDSIHVKRQFFSTLCNKYYKTKFFKSLQKDIHLSPLLSLVQLTKAIIIQNCLPKKNTQMILVNLHLSITKR